MISPDVDVEAAVRFARYAASRPSEHDRLKDYWTRWFKQENPHMTHSPENSVKDDDYRKAMQDAADKHLKFPQQEPIEMPGDLPYPERPDNRWTGSPDPWKGVRGTPNAPYCSEPFTDADLSILTEAHGLVHGDRQASYGHPAVDFSRTAALVNTLLAAKLSKDLDAADVALFMVCVKLSREAHQHGRDNLVDACGYLECRERVLRFLGEQGE